LGRWGKRHRYRFNIYIIFLSENIVHRSCILFRRNALDEITEKYRRERALGIAQYLFVARDIYSSSRYATPNAYCLQYLKHTHTHIPTHTHTHTHTLRRSSEVAFLQPRTKYSSTSRQCRRARDCEVYTSHLYLGNNIYFNLLQLGRTYIRYTLE